MNKPSFLELFGFQADLNTKVSWELQKSEVTRKEENFRKSYVSIILNHSSMKRTTVKYVTVFDIGLKMNYSILVVQMVLLAIYAYYILKIALTVIMSLINFKKIK